MKAGKEWNVLIVEDEQDSIHLVITDQNRPGISGLELLPEVILRSINDGEGEENRRMLQALRRQLLFVRSLKRDYPYLAALVQQEEAHLLFAQAEREGEA